MTIYCSKNGAGRYVFYHDNVHKPDQIPPDAVEVSEDLHRELLAAHSIEAGPDGTPKAVPFAMTIRQQGLHALSQGIEITSTSYPAIDGTYACNDEAVANLLSASLHVKIFEVFPGDDPHTLDWPDKSGTTHLFTDQATFLMFSANVSNYHTSLKKVVNHRTDTLPPSSIKLD